MLDTQKEEALAANYIQLFQGLDVEVAQESIREEIERTEMGLLSNPFPSKEAEAKIRELVTLYPHPEVYRRAMRFFELTRRSDEASLFGVRLLDLVPGDREAQLQVARFLLNNDVSVHQGFLRKRHRRLTNAVDVPHLVSIAERAYSTGQLTVVEKVRLADLLEDLDEHARSFEIANACLESEEFDDPDVRSNATAIAARTAMKLGRNEDAAKLVAAIPPSRLRGELASVAIQLKLEAGDKQAAFELAKEVFSRDLAPGVIGIAAGLAQELGRQSDLEEVLFMNPEFETRARHRPEIIWELERHGFDPEDIRERHASARRTRRRG